MYFPYSVIMLLCVRCFSMMPVTRRLIKCTLKSFHLLVRSLGVPLHFELLTPLRNLLASGAWLTLGENYYSQSSIRLFGARDSGARTRLCQVVMRPQVKQLDLFSHAWWNQGIWFKIAACCDSICCEFLPWTSGDRSTSCDYSSRLNVLVELEVWQDMKS